MMKLREKERDDLWVIKEREEERKKGFGVVVAAMESVKKKEKSDFDCVW